MEFLKICINVEPVNAAPIAPIPGKENALYLDKGGVLHHVNDKVALGILEEFGENCQIALLGNSDYMVVYPDEARTVIDGEDYLFGDYVVMKTDCGLEVLTEKEVEEVLQELESYMTELALGDHRVNALEITGLTFRTKEYMACCK